MDEEADEAPPRRLNARATDVFDLGNLTFYPGPSPYLERRALVFDLALTGSPQPLPIAQLCRGGRPRAYPHLTGAVFPDHAHLFAALVSEVGKLDIGLELQRWRVQPRGRFYRVATQALDRRTQHQVVYFVWDWLEAIALGRALRPCGPHGDAAGSVQPLALWRPHHLRHPARRRAGATSRPAICGPKG